MPPTPLSVTIITLNEEANIARAVKSVAWADDVLVVDSGSSDRTVEIALSLGARVLHNPWRGYGQQKNFAQAQAKQDWVFSLDADEEVSPALRAEIEAELAVAPNAGISGFSLPRKTFYLGRWIRYGGWYPNRLARIGNRQRASWTEPMLHESLAISGVVHPLKEALYHHSFPSIESQVRTNLKFSKLGSEELRKHRSPPALALLFLKPVGKFLETYLLKGGFLDGLAGFIISINAAYSIFLKYAYFFEPRIDRQGCIENLENQERSSG